jgi:hypothetical protein
VNEAMWLESTAAYVFVLLTDHKTHERTALRMDDIIAVTAQPRRHGIEREIANIEARIAECEKEGVTYDWDRMIDVEADKRQLARLVRERDATHNGSAVQLDSITSPFAVAETPEEVLRAMDDAMRPSRQEAV